MAIASFGLSLINSTAHPIITLDFAMRFAITWPHRPTDTPASLTSRNPLKTMSRRCVRMVSSADVAPVHVPSMNFLNIPISGSPPSGTYGGHLELSAFASLKKKEIKIVQPGLVYVVSGDDDSRDAVIERQAIEQERQRIQDSLPPPSTEELSLSSREARRKKRTARQANTRESSEEPGAAAASGSRSAANSPAPLLPKNGVVEAFGPLYIA